MATINVSPDSVVSMSHIPSDTYSFNQPNPYMIEGIKEVSISTYIPQDEYFSQDLGCGSEVEAGACKIGSR